MSWKVKHRSFFVFLARQAALPVTLLAIVLASCSADLGAATVETTALPSPQLVVITKTPGVAKQVTEISELPDPAPTATRVATEIFLTQLENQPTPTDEPLFQICSPLVEHPLEELRLITSDPYRPPPPRQEGRHEGVDFSYYRHGERTTIQGVSVQAILPGRVAMSLQDTFPYGNVVIIETLKDDLQPELQEMIGIAEGQSLYSLYAHMNLSPLVETDQFVSACQLLGEVGTSGNSFEPHLHLETRLGPSGRSFPSMGYYKADNTDEEKTNYVTWRTGGEFNHFDPMSVLNFGLANPEQN